MKMVFMHSTMMARMVKGDMVIYVKNRDGHRVIPQTEDGKYIIVDDALPSHRSFTPNDPEAKDVAMRCLYKMLAHDRQAKYA